MTDGRRMTKSLHNEMKLEQNSFETFISAETKCSGITARAKTKMCQKCCVWVSFGCADILSKDGHGESTTCERKFKKESTELW